LNPGNRYLVAGALVLVQVFFGLHYLAAKIVMQQIPPRAWALLRVSGALAVMLVVLAIRRQRLPAVADWGRFAVFALFGVVINQFCFVQGLSRTSATHSSLINATIPVVTFAIAVLAGRERARLAKLAALFVAFAGAALVIRPDEFAPDAVTMFAGDLFTAVNAVSFSLFLVISKRTFERVDPLAATTLLLLFGSLGMSLLGGPELIELEPARVSAATWALGAGIVLFPTVGAYAINTWALARVESSLVAFFIFLQPLIATSLSMAFLGDRPGIRVAWGATLVILGSALVIRTRS